ncbi:hypothetical protein RM549_03330 [Salegentibacter sp. F188]|uniref:Uncharacterized protein n=1 Tax=Autumnicola patrickiae TaxID=3075591 RepID=A0ABU3DYR0_9FLAO|nr:hypothetical protein [Salegentibacter sp. F188]MDT0688798.1 hypothetical protein [Salegentibacter sp. F188]
MISSSSKKRNLSSETSKVSFVQQLSSWTSTLNLELFFSLFLGGIFLAIFIFSDNVLLEELSKAMIIITFLSLFRFLKPNSNNL